MTLFITANNIRPKEARQGHPGADEFIKMLNKNPYNYDIYLVPVYSTICIKGKSV